MVRGLWWWNHEALYMPAFKSEIKRVFSDVKVSQIALVSGQFRKRILTQEPSV